MAATNSNDTPKSSETPKSSDISLSSIITDYSHPLCLHPSDHPRWQEAMDAELAGLAANDTWTTVSFLPVGEPSLASGFIR